MTPHTLAKLTQEQDGRAADGAGNWIEWKGGICPVDPMTRIEYRLRWFKPGQEPFHCSAGFCRWDHGRSPEAAADRSTGDGLSDIIAYRVVPA